VRNIPRLLLCASLFIIGVAESRSILPEPVAPDLDKRLARWKPVSMPFDARSLSPRERRLIETLVDACRDLENAYWRQIDPQDVGTYNALAGSSDPRDRTLRRLLWINGSRWDLLDEDRPFLGTEPMPPGALSIRKASRAPRSKHGSPRIPRARRRSSTNAR
jgi:hypothetical protein